MAIIWADFPSGQRGIYDNNAAYMLNGVWAENGGGALVNDPDPNIGSAGIVFRSIGQFSAAGGGRFVIPAEVTTLGVAVRLWMSNLPISAGSAPFITFRTNINSDIITVRVSTTGQVEAASGTDGAGEGGTSLGFSVPCLTANAYNHIEIKATKGAGTGAVEVRVNGTAKLTLTGLTLSASNIAQFYMGSMDVGSGSDITCYWKDLIVWDTSGSYSNDFQGALAVYDMVPDSDISLNWTPSTGATGWNLIDENVVNDADYISAASPPPAAAVFGLTNLPPDVTTIRALLPIYRAVKSDGGDCTLQAGLTPNNVDWVNGAARPMTTAFTYWWDALHTSPATTAPWTPAEANAAYVRVNRTV